MTISYIEPVITYVSSGNGVYPFAFKVLAESDINVWYTSASTGARVQLVRGSDFSVAVSDSGGTVTILDNAPAGGQILIERRVPIDQPTDWVNNGPFDMDLLEADLDRIIMIVQQLGWDVSSGQAAINYRGPWVTLAEYTIRDIVRTTNGNYYFCVVSHTSGTFATDLADGNWVLLIDFEAIETHATNAAASEVAAGLSEVNAAASATAAGLSEVNAAASASAAQASAASAAAVPVGVIVPFVGGYFGGPTNGGFVNVLGNTVAAVNALMNPTGWYVCNGAAPNVAGSPIFNTASRYLPNLTDSRFIMGSTGAGTPGGTNDITHSHTMNNHTHTLSHTHGVTIPYKETGNPNNLTTDGSSAANVGNTALSTDQLAAHTHFSLLTSHPGSAVTGFSDVTYPATRLYGYQTGSTGSSANHTHSMAHTHLHPHFHAFNSFSVTSDEASNGTTSQATGNTGSTSLSNLPQYLSAIYIMKVI